MSWIVKESGFDPQRIAMNGNKFMTGNGALGIRGTLEEFGKEELTATIIAGLYDQVGDQWREPVNAPNGLMTKLHWNGVPLSVLEAKAGQVELPQHEQSLDIFHAVHRRKSVFSTPDGAQVTVFSERWCSAARLDLIVQRFTVQSSREGELVINTGIDGEVWDINGPHLERLVSEVNRETNTSQSKGLNSVKVGHTDSNKTDNLLTLTGWTHELNVPVTTAAALEGSTMPEGFGEQWELQREGNSISQIIRLHVSAETPYTWVKYVSVVAGSVGGTGEVQPSSVQAAVSSIREAQQLGYDRLYQEHAEQWERKWSASDIVIEGDEEAQLALRYSMYQLHIIAPDRSEKVSIPARGLSGQVYKGAVFWDTEMFMLPFFLYTRPEVARNLLMYRVHTLDGARRKAAEYGYEGAFYAWESQETGDDACTLFNVNDVFTGRPMRTFFRDKQVHISADVACGIWQYYVFTGDESILLDGGAEVVWECARFFYSYAYFNPSKQQYEILDVTGPDEYHERVNNNAFTNRLVKETLRIAIDVMALLQKHDSRTYDRLLAEGSIRPEHIQDMHDGLYVPQPDPASGIIEQFDGYFTLEDVALPELKARMINPHEYLGGGNGLATTTQILKQADVVLMLHLYKDEYAQAIKQANWEFYEPRTEHGSSLSSCVYALVAADIGSPDWAYPYFLKTATIDLTGESKQYVGDLYIGGTHTAANGGAWMAAVLGFAGLRYDGVKATLKPALPSAWQAVEFPVRLREGAYRVRVGRENVLICSEADNTGAARFVIGEQELAVMPGQQVSLSI
ncbi:glycosyl hydrolase family 65 protein [Paenibacillus sanguinis]|uniref:glycosyl hydrolase family 65 protein n=1 Tax=Paenibacillus sanguinis TaxID=225906 RepID=UPI00036D8D69|nr:glycosyl hydrolase family 65 protein [Paenibacillus sanguinis]